jgi:glutaredoxin-like protein
MVPPVQLPMNNGGMALLGPDDQQRLREEFAGMTRRVHLVFFTQSLGCETCVVTRQILDELPPLSDQIVIDEVNFILEPERGKEYGIDRVPAIAVAYEDADAATSPPPLRDTRMRFLGAPAGYEFVSLVESVTIAGGRSSELSAASLAQLATLERPVTMHVFTTPTCPHCPRAVVLALQMAAASPNVTAYAVEATEFPDLARKYHVTGVPKTIVDDSVEILGAVPEEEFVAQALGLNPATS